ncbi:MAG: DUF4358 domain-containing protein [Eubacterium sp.]|nr:DUF4358 domain-containing protein [Eubacterium sp.]
MTRILELKWICFGAMLVLLFSSLIQATPSKAPFDQVKTAVTASADMENMTEGDNLMIRRLYGLDRSAYQGAALYYPASNMGAEELLLIQMKDAAQQDTIEEAIRNRIKTQKKSFDGYGTEQMGLLADSLIEAKGNYILFAVAEDPDAVRDAFLGAL